MTNHLTPNFASIGGSSGDPAHVRRTHRPVKLVEHPAFRGRRERPVAPVTVGRLGALRVVSLDAAARTRPGSPVATTSILEAA